MLEGAFDDGGFGGVDHEGQGRLGGETAGHLGHVGHAVRPRVIDTNVDDVAAGPHGFLGQGRASVPVLGQHGVAEALGAVGVGALAHVEHRRRLVVGHVGVQRRAAGFEGRCTRGRLGPAQRLHHGFQVGRGGAATSSDDVDAELGDEAAVVVGQLLGGEVVVHLALDHGRQAGIGQARHRHPGVSAQVTQVLAHFGWSRGAIEPDDVGPQGVQGRESSPDLAAHEHASRRLDGDLDLDRHLTVGLRHGSAAADDGRLGLEQILDGLDQEQVDATCDKAGGGILIAVSHVGKGNLAQRGDLGPRPQGAGHEVARPVAVGDVSGDRSRRYGQFPGPPGHPVLGQYPRQRAEAVGFDHPAAHFEK